MTRSRRVQWTTRWLLGLWLSVAGCHGICRAAEPVPADQMELAIERAVSYLLQSVQADGSFVYRVNMNPAVEVAPGYNVLRHAGGIYALSMYCQAHPNRFVQPALQRSLTFFRDKTIEPVPKMTDCLAVWSKPEMVGVKSVQAKLGGTGLGLVAVISAREFVSEPVPLEDLRAMGRFICNMQRADGSFYSKYIPSQWWGRYDKWVSLYYPGEAALGMLMLYEMDPDPKWLACAQEALGYLARERQGQQDVPADHWALLATARLWDIRQDDPNHAMEEIYLNHAAQICEVIMNQQVLESSSESLNGGFTGRGLVTPTSTRLEGLLAAYRILPQEHPLRERMAEAIHHGMAFLQRAQVKEGVYAGAFHRAVVKLPLRIKDSQAFNQRATEIRVDYVQHALSAMLQYQACFHPSL